ncbi:AMP-binding protein [bacterium]|nr:AMP-binding protein [bacterium]
MKERQGVANILVHLERKTEEFANNIALGIKTHFGWKEFTYRGIGLMSRKIASYFIDDIQLKKGDRVAILSESRPEYGACVFATVMAGAIVVPLDIKLTQYELKSILSNCEPTVIMASQSKLEVALEMQKQIPSIQHVILMDEPSNDNLTFTSIYTLPNKFENKWRHRSSRSTALIIYTSGTTGAPKGVEISYRNMMAQLNDMAPIYKYLFGDKQINVLSILPMNHLFELTVGFSVFLSWGLSVYYTQSLKPKDILSTMQEKKVNFMIVVPAFLKLLKAGIEQEINASSKFVQVMFKVMFFIAGLIPNYAIRRMIFSRVQKKFGGHFYGCISGGAALDPKVGMFFDTMGIRVYQGYGLTEMSPVVSVNYDRKGAMSSIGRPLNSVETKIDETSGEILLRGPSLMKGYYKNPEMTAQVIDENGWYHTGDIGRIDNKGYLYITGRIKNMIVLSGGKKVFPEEVETVMESSEHFAEVCVFGYSRTSGAKEGTEDVAIVVVPKDSVIAKYGDDKKALEDFVKVEVKHLSNQLASYKRPMYVFVTTEPLPKTTTRKVKRREVKELVGV